MDSPTRGTQHHRWPRDKPYINRDRAVRQISCLLGSARKLLHFSLSLTRTLHPEYKKPLQPGHCGQPRPLRGAKSTELTQNIQKAQLVPQLCLGSCMTVPSLVKKPGALWSRKVTSTVRTWTETGHHQASVTCPQRKSSDEARLASRPLISNLVRLGPLQLSPLVSLSEWKL